MKKRVDPSTANDALADLRHSLESLLAGGSDVRGLAPFRDVFPNLIPALLSMTDRPPDLPNANTGAFEAFVRGGSTARLYERMTSELATHYPPHSSLLDIGCGDGLALLPALQKGGVSILEATLVEPSLMRLRSAEARLARWVPGLRLRSKSTTLAAFLEAAVEGDRWSVAQATFSLHAIAEPERWQQLAALRRHIGKLVIVEFDASDLVVETNTHLLSLLSRYDQAIGEYTTTRDLVAGGHLLPMLLARFAGAASAIGWEQPMDHWVKSVSAAGYAIKRAELLSAHFWSPAFVLIAEPL